MVEDKNYIGQRVRDIATNYGRRRLEEQYPAISSISAAQDGIQAARDLARQREDNTGFSWLRFFGILISIFTLLASITSLIGTTFLSFDKNGEEVYTSDGEKFTLTDLMKRVITNGPIKGIKTDYRGWFQRSHDIDSILNEYDSFLEVFLVGTGSGMLCFGYSLSAIFFFNSNRAKGKLCVSSL